MATITCIPDGKTIEIGPSETILQVALRADIPHAHACGGNAKCTTCRVAILKGLENCSQRTILEQALASRLGFAPEVRLACQTRPRGDVSFRRLVLDKTDYEIASQLAKDIDMGEGTIYPLMRRMQSDGQVETYLVESQSGPPRKYYRLTPAGRNSFTAQKAEWAAFVSAVDTILGAAA